MVGRIIEKTGKISKASDSDKLTAEIIETSYNLPEVKVESKKEFKAFLSDDGGY